MAAIPSGWSTLTKRSSATNSAFESDRRDTPTTTGTMRYAVPANWPPPLTGSTRVEPQAFLRPVGYDENRSNFWQAFMYEARDCFTIIAIIVWPWALVWLTW